MCHENEEWCKNWREIDLLFYNWYEEFDEFLPEHSKVSNIYTLMGPFFIKVYNVWTRKVQSNYLSWQWILMQNLKENWLVLSKMTGRIWQPDQSEAVWKLYFTLEINEHHS